MTTQALAPAGSSLLSRALATRPDWAPVAMRLTLAGVMFPHGAQKLFGWFGGYGFGSSVEFLGSIGVPTPVAASVILLEVLAPVLLVLGLGTRFAALSLVGIMLGAIATVHGPYGFFMNWTGAQAGEGFEYHLLVIGLAVALACSGSGRLGLDAGFSIRLQDRIARGGAR